MPVDEFAKNPQRLTPYPNFRFKVIWAEGVAPVCVAGFSKVSALTPSKQVIRHREGGDPSTMHVAPGQTAYGPITFERGMSFDVRFEAWANKVFDNDTSKIVGEDEVPSGFRKNLIIEIYNEAGQKVLAYNVYNAWVSDYQAISDLDANGDAAILIQSMTVQNEGWTRDDSFAEPMEPRFTLPKG